MNPSKPKPIPKSYHCQICDLSVTSEAVLKDHLLGKSHKKKLNNKKILDDFQHAKEDSGGGGIEGAESSAPAEAAGPILQCDLCNVKLNSMQQYSIHLAGT